MVGAPTTPPRFIADCMLGRLAKWLRVLGYDVAYDRRISDDALIARTLREGRVLLSRDRRLVRRRTLREAGAEWVLIASDDPERQIVQMMKDRGLEVRPALILSRCLRCNEPTRPASREQVEGRVPNYVHRTQLEFSRCPACDRIYWKATHVSRMMEYIERALRAGG